MRITKALIAAAGVGARLMPATKEQPKEMLPLFSRTNSGKVCLKPVLQLVYEHLYDAGFREFCFVIGKGKRAIEDHFTQDYGSLAVLGQKQSYDEDLRRFYQRLDDSIIVWVNQPNPRGFGDAVLRGRGAIGDDSFLVHAGDTCILSEGISQYRKLVQIFEEVHADAAFLVKRVPETRERGVIKGNRIRSNLYAVTYAEEKPEVPFSDLAIEPIYLFGRSIFDSLADTKPGWNSEIQLTDGIQRLVAAERAVYAMELEEGILRLDIGSPESYWDALRDSHQFVSKRSSQSQ